MNIQRTIAAAITLLALTLATSTSIVEAAPLRTVNLAACQDATGTHFTVQWDDVRVTNGVVVGYRAPGDFTTMYFEVKGTRHGQAIVDQPVGTGTFAAVDVNLAAGRKVTTQTFSIGEIATCGQ
jgi:hypothetical protein